MYNASFVYAEWKGGKLPFNELLKKKYAFFVEV